MSKKMFASLVLSLSLSLSPAALAQVTTDACWIVSRHWGDAVYKGVAECPDEKTALVVLEALRLRRARAATTRSER